MTDYIPPATVEEALRQLDEVAAELKLDPPLMTKVFDAKVVLMNEVTRLETDCAELRAQLRSQLRFPFLPPDPEVLRRLGLA